MKTAVLYNPKAGKGIPAEQVLTQLSSFFEGEELLVAEQELVCEGLPIRLVDYSREDGSYLGLLSAKVKALVEAGAECFVSVGGDGTATYVRNVLYRMGLDIPMLGVAAGTANVGPIVSVSLEQLAGRTVREARYVDYDGVAVYAGDELISLAFNDVIIGDTFLATVNGSGCNVSVRELLCNGAIVPQSPSVDMVKDDFRVELNGEDILPAGRDIQQIIISSVAHESHYGRAVYGPIGKCDWCEKKGVIALCDHIAVSFEENNAGTGRFSSMQYLIFGPNDDVALKGFTPKACLVCDGNPYLLEQDNIRVKYENSLVKTITI